MSDSIAPLDEKWQPLVPEPPDISGSTGVGDAFQYLYKIPEKPEPGREFIPFYGQPVFDDTRQAPAAAAAVEPDTEAAEEKPEQIRQQAYEEGFARGEEQGFAAGKQNAEPILDEIRKLLQEVDGLWRHLVQSYEERILELVCRVSEKVILAHVALDHETVKRVILDAFRLVPEPAEVTIEISPQAAEAIEAVKEDFFDQIKGLNQISLQPDPSVNPGGCRLKTRFGEVDATLETRLAAVQETIRKVSGNMGENDSRG